MSLANVFAAVAKKLPQDIHFHVSRGEVNFAEAPPRIVLVPLRERFSPPQGMGGDGVAQPRPLWTRNVTIQAHVWAENQDRTEVLANVLAVALHEVAYGSYQLVDAEWMGGTDGQLGFVYVMTFMVHVPVTNVTEWERPLTELPTTTEFTDEV